MIHSLGIICRGNMGAAIMRGVIGEGAMGSGAVGPGAVGPGVIPADRIIVVDIDEAKRAEAEALGCKVSDNPADASDAEQIMLAVKPQVFPVVAERLAPLVESKIVISIMAGLSSRNIRAALGENARIVRVMPNTPCQVGAGMSAIALGEGAKEGDDELAMKLCSALGETVRVREEQMYAVTATSGSGPAYVFLLAEAMQEAAINLGLEPEKAALLVNQTILGAGKLLRQSDQSPEALRSAVTSPKGTTEAALKVMLKREMPGIIDEALTAARDRGIELDQG
ncbi:MAG: pyrroline-5-carboxylate reductase [Planctomycetes bacterium]|nr:pyrroline-5-carboxylate reductase [Planctomycetota bacterium]